MELRLEALPWWGWGIALLAAAGMTFLFVRKPGSRVLWITRAVVLGALVALMAKPVRVVRETQSRKPVLAVLADCSRSMAVKDPGSRHAALKKFLEDQAGALESSFDVRYFGFAETSVRMSLDELLKRPADGQGTDLALALESAQKETQGRLAALLLLSDGANTGSRSPVEAARELNAPVTAVALGANSGLKDLSVDEVRASDFAFQYTPVEIAAAVSGIGFAGREISVALKRNEEVVATRPVLLSEDGRPEEVSFGFVPRAVGDFQYSIEVPPHQGELTLDNNSRSFPIHVGRQKIRVLAVCGQPSPEYYFLRHLLKSEPSVELVSFVILRNPESVATVAENELSLIPFPTQEIFSNDLFGFDVLIMENFSYRRFGILGAYLDNIRRFVEKGGGFVMLGGENAFGLGGYTGTPIETLLPVSLSPQENLLDERMDMEPTNLQHPLWQGVQEALGAPANWRPYLHLEGANATLRVKPQATLLGTANGGRIPILAAWKYGKGRAMALASNTSWRWALEASSRDGKTELYEKFWRGAVRWLSGSESSAQVRIALENREGRVDAKTRVLVYAFDQNYAPLAHGRVVLSVSDPHGVKRELDGYFRKDGEYSAEFVPASTGPHRITAMAFAGERLLGRDEKTLSVGSESPEDRALLFQETALRRIAEATGGRFFKPGEFQPGQIPSLPLKTLKAPVVKEVSLWNSAWFYAALIGALILEWYFRRKQGLL